MKLVLVLAFAGFALAQDAGLDAIIRQVEQGSARMAFEVPLGKVYHTRRDCPQLARYGTNFNLTTDNVAIAHHRHECAVCARIRKAHGVIR